MPIYYELHNLFDDEGIIHRCDTDIAEKGANIEFMDISDTYYMALVLDSRNKDELLL